MGFAENLKMLMKEKSKTADDIARLMGVSRGTITHWSNGVRFPQDDTKIRPLASVLGVSEQELLNPKRRLHVKAYDGAVTIPVLEGLAGCGSAGILEQLRLTEDNMVIDKRIFPADIISKNLTMIRIVGDSMQPYLDENDWAVVQMRNGADVVLTGAVYMLARGDDVQIKRCTFKPDGTCVIISQRYISYHFLSFI